VLLQVKVKLKYKKVLFVAQGTNRIEPVLLKLFCSVSTSKKVSLFLSTDDGH
jgi:hypothetical protein